MNHYQGVLLPPFPHSLLSPWVTCSDAGGAHYISVLKDLSLKAPSQVPEALLVLGAEAAFLTLEKSQLLEEVAPGEAQVLDLVVQRQMLTGGGNVLPRLGAEADNLAYSRGEGGAT